MLMISTETGLETWTWCAEMLELNHLYPGNAVSSATMPTPQPKQHVNTTRASSPSTYLTMFSVSWTPYLPPIRSRLSKDCVLYQLLLSPSFQITPWRSWHHWSTCTRIIYYPQAAWRVELNWTAEVDVAGSINLPKIPTAALECASKHLFSNVRTLASILCVLLATTCASQSSHNTLKLVKNHLRSPMGNERLTGLILMYVHRNIEVDPEKVISEFARRLEPQNIMSEC